MLPKNNTLPNRNYKAKKILCPMGLEYKKINKCLNDGVLYKDEFVALKACLTCELSQFKNKFGGNNFDEETNGPPVNMLWYLPI